MYYGDPFSYGPRPRVVPLVPVRAPSPATDEVKGHVLWCKTEKHPTKEEIQKAKYHKAYRVFDKDNDGLEFTVHVVHPLPSNCAEIVALEGQKTFDKLASEFRNDVKRYVRKDNLEQARKVYKSLERMAEEAKDKFGRKIAMGVCVRQKLVDLGSNNPPVQFFIDYNTLLNASERSNLSVCNTS
ncbi:hypothetical protein P154DRAFT_566077 [Amniculicola lignicola CBS 123094]|uniref:Uncharacterized protein n=1 Tax=Amniculicola lignicola CBS 123094 TaxID=1392246 RepID=A0A6A5W6E0_9PLEO|nr:hypothetical protein P154DRAFT_566077 [Amniculicola lignicola CBS 123094]